MARSVKGKSGGDVDVTAMIDTQVMGNQSIDNRWNLDFQDTGIDAGISQLFSPSNNYSYLYLNDGLTNSNPVEPNVPGYNRFTGLFDYRPAGSFNASTPYYYEMGTFAGIPAPPPDRVVPPWSDPGHPNYIPYEAHTNASGIPMDGPPLGSGRSSRGSRSSQVESPYSWYDPADERSPFQQMRDQESVLVEELNNRMVTSANAHGIGGKEYREQLRQERVKAGLEEAPEEIGFGQRIRNNWDNLLNDRQTAAFTLGYSAMTMSGGISKEIELTQSGRLVTPEQKQAADVEAFAPGLMSIVGTVAGGALGGPGGALAGQFTGQGIGNVITSLAGASAEKTQATRETSEMLATETGGAAAAVREFTEALKAAGAPIQQLQQGLGVLSNLGPGAGSMSAVYGANAMANVLGERFNPMIESTAGFLGANPILHPLIPGFSAAGSRIDPNEAGSLAIVAAAGGDYGAARQFLVNEQAGRTPANIASAEGFERRYESENPVLRGLHNLFIPTRGEAISDAYDLTDRYTNSGQRARDATANKLDADAVDAFTKLSFSAGSDIKQMQAGLGLTSAQIGLAQAGGASAGQLQALAAGMVATASSFAPGVRALDTQIDQYLASNPNLDPAIKAEFVNVKQSLTTQNLVGHAQAAGAFRGAFMSGIEEAGSGFAETEKYGYYSGQTARQQSGVYEQEASYYIDTASNMSNPLSPAERAKMRVQGMDISFGNRMNIFSNEEAQLSIARSAGLYGLSQAQISGSFADVATQSLAIAGADTASAARIASELAAGNLPDAVKQQLTQQYNQLAGSAMIESYQAPIAQYEGERGALSNLISGSMAGVARRVIEYGNAGVGDLSTFTDRVTRDRAEIDRNTDPKRTSMLVGTEESDWESYQSALDIANTYHPDAATSMMMTKSKGAFQRSLISPFQDGPNSDPYQRGLDVERADQTELSQLRANRTRHQSAGSWRLKDEVRFTEQQEDMLSQIAQVEHQRLYGMSIGFAEMTIGSVPGGAGSAVTPWAAAAAAFTPSPLWGSRGPQSAGNVPAYAPSQNAGFTAAATGGNDTTTNQLLQQLISAVKDLKHTNSLNAGGGTNMPKSAGPLMTELGRTFNINDR